jgi:IclR family KDG regulon transcriptional repressor
MESKRERATSLRRGLDLLLALGEDEALEQGGLGVMRLSELVGSDKSRVSRTLRILADYRLLERDPETLAYRLGWKLFILARRLGDSRLERAGTLHVEQLVDLLDEGAYISVLLGADVVTLIARAPARTVHATSQVGRVTESYCSSSGRALLSAHSREELNELFAGVEFQPHGPNTPRHVEDLWQRLQAARPRGYAIVDEEFEPGLVGVAAPIHDFTGRVIAAINVSAPKFRFADQLESAGEHVRAAAEELSRALRWQRPAEEPPTPDLTLLRPGNAIVTPLNPNEGTHNAR